jgi:hypothetical protein
MSGAIPPLHQYVFIVWCVFKAQGQPYLFFTIIFYNTSLYKVALSVLGVKRLGREADHSLPSSAEVKE